uniref:Interleukin 20 receptor subunit beta n=1 Tax=Terrapene triunguis TaxID=2587831 RepID=A0A674I5T1_9SAUR
HPFSGSLPSVVHLDTIEAGAEYCVKAQTYVEAINRSSNFSQTQCVHGSIWMTTALVSFVGFVVGVLALPFLAWKMSQIFQYSCCPVVVLPDTLVISLSSLLFLGSLTQNHLFKPLPMDMGGQHRAPALEMLACFAFLSGALS